MFLTSCCVSMVSALSESVIARQRGALIYQTAVFTVTPCRGTTSYRTISSLPGAITLMILRLLALGSLPVAVADVTTRFQLSFRFATANLMYSIALSSAETAQSGQGRELFFSGSLIQDRIARTEHGLFVTASSSTAHWSCLMLCSFIRALKFSLLFMAIRKIGTSASSR